MERLEERLLINDNSIVGLSNDVLEYLEYVLNDEEIKQFRNLYDYKSDNVLVAVLDDGNGAYAYVLRDGNGDYIR